MAVVLPDYSFDKPSDLSKTRRYYPWSEWFDGRIWQLFPGTDFDSTPLMMERVIRGTAVRKRYSVKIRHDGDSIVLQAVPKA